MLLALAGLGGVALAAPPTAAPAPVGPVDGASVTIPFTISWTAPGDPAAVGGYNWQVSRTADFATVIERNPVLLTGTTSDVVSGLPNGDWFWRVQAVSRAQEPGPWSAPRSVVVTGAGADVPGTPVLDPPRGGPRFHVDEIITFSWTAVPGAVDYVLQESTDPSFPVDTRVRQVNLLGTTAQVSFNASNQGTFQARVLAVNAEGQLGSPSNLVSFSVLDSNPLPAPPTIVGPLGGGTQPLAVTLTWNHVANPQQHGYQVQISTNSSFSSVERSFGDITDAALVVPTLTPGAKFWRVRSQHGYIGIDPAFTAWSATGSFTVPASAGVQMSTVTFPGEKYSGGEARGSVALTGPAPAGGAVVTFSTSHPALLPELPASRVVPAGDSSVLVLVAPTGSINSLRGMRVGFVTAPTTVTVTATYNGTSASTPITLLPPRLNDTPFQLFPVKATGGTDMSGIVDLEGGCFGGFCDGLAPPGGFPVSLSTSAPAATVPATVTIPAGAGGTDFLIRTSPVSTTTTITITARAGDAVANWRITLSPEPTPDTFRLDPVETTSGSRGIVTIPLSATLGYDQRLRVTSSNPAVAAVPEFVTVPSSMDSGVFPITTSAVGARTVVTITVTGGGVSRTAELAVSPNLPALTALTVSPTSVPGGTPATGTVTLGSAAPTGGVVVSLGSNLPGAATVPSTVTVPAGATSATFAVTTSAVDATTVQLSATLGSASQFASLGITRASGLSALTLSPATVAGGTSSTGTVTLGAAAPSGGLVVSLSDNSGAATVPASVTVPAGSLSRTFTVTTSAVTAQTAVVVTGSSAGVTRSATLTVNPSAPSTLAAPTLQSPANDARFSVGRPITFDWSDVPGAAGYTIQIDDQSTFGSPAVNQAVTPSTYSSSALPATRLWWRVRATDAAGNPGAWSAVRRIEVR